MGRTYGFLEIMETWCTDAFEMICSVIYTRDLKKPVFDLYWFIFIQFL